MMSTFEFMTREYDDCYNMVAQMCGIDETWIAELYDGEEECTEEELEKLVYYAVAKVIESYIIDNDLCSDAIAVAVAELKAEKGEKND